MNDLMILPPQSAPRRSKKHGHAAVPGTGPAGETCGTCAHLYRRTMASTYLKCSLMRAHWTRGQGSDVGAKDAACRRWERPEATDAG